MKSVVILLPAAAVLLVAGCGGHGLSDKDASANLSAAQVRLTTVHTEVLVLQNEISGTVRPLKTAQLAAKVMGTIEKMPVELGQRVHAGDRLVEISADEISARVAQAQAQFNAARRDLERESALLTKGASTTDTVKGIEDRFSAAQAMVKEAEAMLGYATIRAPFDGNISRKFADVGDLASPGVPLLEIESADRFQVEVALPDSIATQLVPGALLAITIPNGNINFTGKLVELSSAADPSAHTVMAMIQVPAEVSVRSGEFARVQVEGAPVEALMVPASAVTTAGQMQRVFVANDDNRAALRLVKTGAARGDWVEILSGLDNNERVVVAPPVGLREGQPLEVQP